jgi:hypothetical protein
VDEIGGRTLDGTKIIITPYGIWYIHRDATSVRYIGTLHRYVTSTPAIFYLDVGDRIFLGTAFQVTRARVSDAHTLAVSFQLGAINIAFFSIPWNHG